MSIRDTKKSKVSLFFAGLFILLAGLGADVLAQKVRIRAQITPNCNSGTSRLKFADIYADGNIAVQGSYQCRGAFIYNISNPDAPTLAAHYNPGANQQFLEAIVVGNRGYFGSGNSGGVHIVDLTNPAAPVLLGIVNPTSGNGFASIHEMVVFSQNGATYLIENNNVTSNKLLKVINVTNPAAPVFVRDINPTEVSWVHAVHIRGNRMYTSGWGNGTARGKTEIYDITNVGTQAPVLLGFIEDPTSTTAGNNMHSSWTSEDGNFLYSCRETSNGNGDVRVYNVSNPAQPMLVKRIGMNDLALNAVTPHNPVVMGDKLYVAWYQAGIQVFDIGTNPSDPKRIGQYDTYQPAFAPPSEEETAGTLAGSEPWDAICATESLQNSLPTTYDGNWAVYPFLGEDKVLAGDLTYGLLVLDVTGTNALPKNQVSDFDGDGKTDISVYTPSTGVWSIERSSGGSSTTQFGANGDKIEAGDFDGDGKSDIVVWRPSEGVWYVLGTTRGFFAAQFGANGDVPVAGDYDADGKTDFAVFRPANGSWYIQQSTLGFRATQFGVSTDKPMIGDFEGDGKTDLAVWRPSNGTWYILQSSSSLLMGAQFGISSDKPVTGNFDGDGKTDLAVYRPAEGNWYIMNSQTNSLGVYRFGISSDMPIPADYDGDGKTDVAVFRASENAWYRLNSTNGAFVSKTFGQNGDVPSPSSVQP
ncbi:MAG TPA: FG-GAP-like repeat-containing protein [Pyrinomonadaceae bacterium]|nr:FG-GAP-like repeat-containing protein [Pyrinomonadaceae bacterium]